MADRKYIERGALIKDIEENQRNTEHHKDGRGKQIHVGEHRHFIRMVYEQPAADVVEVVRCKDCAWSRMIVVNGKPEYYCQCWNPGNVIHVDARGFCMWGERKGQT